MAATDRAQPSRLGAPLTEVLGPESALDIYTLVGRASTAAEATARWRERRGFDPARWPSSWTNVVSGDAAPGHLLAPLIDACHRTLVEPHWDNIRRQLDRGAAERARVVAAGGVEGLFRSPHPMACWHDPVLELPSHPGSTVDVHLHGRGVELVPAVFVDVVEGPFWNVDDPSAPAVLFYPAVSSPADRARILVPDARRGGGRRRRSGRGAGRVDRPYARGRPGRCRRRRYDGGTRPPDRHLRRGSEPTRAGVADGRPHHHHPQRIVGRPRPHAARPPSLRWILLTVIDEYARHNGHADLIRESVDGATGQ